MLIFSFDMQRLIYTAKIRLQSLLNAIGYKIERAIMTAHPIDVFTLAARKTALERGEDFFFLQIGANDGVGHDPLNNLIRKYHWRGLLVEPQPKVFQRLKENYATEDKLVFVNSAIAHKDGTKTLYTVTTDGFETGLASFDRDLIVKQLSTGTKLVELSVPAVNLQTLLQRYRIQSVDLLQIDTEGYDYEIIKMCDFSKMKPSVIHYEHRHLSDQDRIACDRLLSAQGYRLHITGPDTVAYREMTVE
jgi:FkbM family methyltransferase